MLTVLDVARWAAVALSLAWIGLLAAAARFALTRPQRARMIACALVLATETGTQAERIGDPASWLTLRLPVVLVACILGIWATWMFVFRGDGNGQPRRSFPRRGRR